jgi:hypothetical protein
MKQSQWMSACALSLVLGIGLARAQEKLSSPELLPAPQCCEMEIEFGSKVEVVKKSYAELMAKFSTLYKEGKYHEAACVAAQAHRLDPDDPLAAAALRIAAARDPKPRHQEVKGLTEQVGADWEVFWFMDLPAQAPKEKPAPCAKCTKCTKECEIQCRLEKPALSVDYKDRPLRQVLDDLAGWTSLNIVIDEAALTEAGINLDHGVTIKAEKVAPKSVLNMVLRNAGLTYCVKDEVVNVTTPTHARGKLQLRTYAVEDLLIPCPPVVKYETNGETVRVVPIGNQDGADRQEATLLRLITNTISPQSWDKMGGLGSIEYFPLGKSVVINQTPDVQEEVSSLLESLRKLPKMQMPLLGPATAQPTPVLAPPQVIQPCPVPVQAPQASVGYEAVPRQPVAPPIAYEPVPPMPMPSAPAYPCPVQQICPPPVPTGGYVAVPCCPVPTEAPSWVLRTSTENGKTLLEMYYPNSDTSTTCENLSVKVPGSGRIKVAPSGKQVQVQATSLAARADRLTSTGRPGYLLLQGHVQLSWKKDGMGAEVSANEILIGLADGHLEVKPVPAAPKPSQPVVQPVSLDFGFFQGFAR